MSFAGQIQSHMDTTLCRVLWAEAGPGDLLGPSNLTRILPFSASSQINSRPTTTTQKPIFTRSPLLVWLPLSF